jgi:foldase protein PrsA
VKTPRRSLLSVLPVLALTFAACGGPKDGDVAVIKTDNGEISISKEQFQRFFNASLSQAQQKELTKTTPLVAPDFKACVAEKRKEIPADSQRKKTSDATLRKQCEEQYDQVRNQAMQQIINLDWVKAEAERQGIAFRKAEVARELNNVIKQSFGDQKGYENFLKQSGLNKDDVNLNIIGQLGQTKIVAELQKDQKEPTAAEVKRYFEQKKAQYVQPETRDLRLIKVADEKTAKDVYNQLKAGGSWKTLAQKFSTDDATKANGGVVLGATADTQPPEFGGTVFKAKSGELLQPIKTSLGWYVVRVQKVTPEKQPVFKELEAQLKQALAQENQQKAVDGFKNLFLARWAARTSCADGYDELVACGGTDATATTPQKLPAPPGAGVPQFPKPKVDPAAQLQQQQVPQQAPTAAG